MALFWINRIMTVKEADINMRFKNMEEVREYSEKENRVLLVLDDCVLDVTTFASHHPGGAGFIKSYQNKQITEQMKSHYPLSLTMATTMTIGKFKEDISRVIDPTQAIMPQVWDLNHEDYVKLCDSPHWLFVESPRMFKTDLMEPFSLNLWNRIFFFPLLAICYLFYHIDPKFLETTNWVRNIATFFLGALTFTLLQYLLHRFLFHSEKNLFDNRLLRYLHFILHGIHHMLPNDPNRLVFPPSLFLIFSTFGSLTIYPFIRPEDDILNLSFYLGFILGYLAYDCTHYMLHHISTEGRKGSYLHRLQQYHNRHHYSHEEAGYGVSSKFWDIVFGTEFKQEAKNHK